MPIVYCAFDFFAKLGELLEDVFVKIFKPIMQVLLEELLYVVIAALKVAFAEIFMSLLSVLLKMVDFFCDIFDILAGVRYVHYTPPGGGRFFLEVGEAGKPAGTIVNYKQTYLLDMFMENNVVVRAFWMITMLAAALAFIFTIYAVAKSISDMTLDNKNPVGKVLGRGLRAAGSFLMVPLTVYVMLQLSTVVVLQVNEALMKSVSDSQGGRPPTVGTIIFLTGSMEAGGNKTGEAASFNDSLRQPYYSGAASYADLEKVKKDFDVTKFMIGTSIVMAGFVLFVIISSLLLFVRRIFEILLLYLVSPLFVATMPLDDGQMFAKWRDLFVAKVFSGFGVVFTMKMYLMLIPMLTGSSLVMSDNPMLNAMLKLFIVIGGAWATFRSQHLFLQILSPEAASTAQMTTGRMMAATMGAMAVTKGIARSAVGGIGGGAGGGAARSRSGGADNAMASHQELYGAGTQKSQAFSGK